jgi:Tfp pilus assembly protein PilO
MKKADLKLILTRYRPFFFPLLIGLVILFLTITLLIPKITQIFEVRQSLSKEKARLAKLTQKLADLEGLDDNELATKATLMVVALPAEKDVPLILATLSSLGREAGMGIESVKVSPGELSTESGKIKKKGKEEETPTLPFEVLVKGTIESLKNFLDRLGSTIPVMRVESASLSFEEGEWQAKISLDTFFLPLPKSLGAVETPLAKISPEEELIYKRIEKYQAPAFEGDLPSVVTGKEDPFSF